MGQGVIGKNAIVQLYSNVDVTTFKDLNFSSFPKGVKVNHIRTISLSCIKEI